MGVGVAESNCVEERVGVGVADSVCVEEGAALPLRVRVGVGEGELVAASVPQVNSAPPPGAAHVHTAGPGPLCTDAPLLDSVIEALTAPSAPSSCNAHPLRFATVSDTPFTEPPPPLAPPSSTTLPMACAAPPRMETSHGAVVQGWQPMQPPREPAANHPEAVLLSKARAAHRAAFAALFARHPQLPSSVLPLSAETEAPAEESARLAPLAPHTCSSATAGMERTHAAPGQLLL